MQRFTRTTIRFENNFSEKGAQANKNNIYIEVQRSLLDNGNNGQFYKSTMSVKSGNKVLFSIQCQSTADHEKLNNGEKKYEGGTIKAGIYKGTLCNRSPSYLLAILITGNDVTAIDCILIHPNGFIGKEDIGYDDNGNPKAYRADNKPQSLACQIISIEDFNSLLDILHELGFESGVDEFDSNGKVKPYIPGDSIKIVIIDAIKIDANKKTENE